MANTYGVTLDSGYDSDCGDRFEPDWHSFELKVQCRKSYDEYCNNTRHTVPSSDSSESSQKVKKCYARDLAGCTSRELVQLISKVTHHGQTFTIELAADAEGAVPHYSDLDQNGMWAMGGLCMCMKRTCTLRNVEIKKPTTEQLQTVISGEYIPELPHHKLLGKRDASKSCIPSQPAEKKVRMQATCSYSKTGALKESSLSVSTSTSPERSSSSQNFPSDSSQDSSPDSSPVSSPGFLLGSSPGSTDQQVQAHSLKCALKRLLPVLEDPNTLELRNNVGKKLVYELFSYLFCLEEESPTMMFTTGSDTNQRGGWRGIIHFQPSSQTSLVASASPVTQVSECPFSGLPDVVGLSKDGTKYLFIIEIKSDSETRGDGVGQLLISAIVWCTGTQCDVLAMLLHPKKITMYKVYINQGKCKIQQLFMQDAGSSSYLNLQQLLQALMIAYKFYMLNK